MQEIMRRNFAKMTIHQQLRFLRKRNRQTQTVVGDLVGMTSRSIRAFETGERLPDLATVSMLAEVLCLDHYEASMVLQSWEQASMPTGARVARAYA